jgi:subtilisin family serine protease
MSSATLLLAALAAAILATPAAPSSAASFRPGVVIVGFHAGVSGGERYAIERAVGGKGARYLGPRSKPGGTAGWIAPLLLNVPNGQVLAAVRRLRSYRAVAYAEPDYLMHADAVPNDPEFPKQWGDSNTGQSMPLINGQKEPQEQKGEQIGTPGADDGALKAWSVTTGSPSIVIGEVDTGVDLEHPDLATNVWSNPGGVGGCAGGTHGYNVLNKTCNPMDDDTLFKGHGTHVAGIMGAIGGNGIGVAGMNWRTTILPVKWLDSKASGQTSSLIEALTWLLSAKEAGVNIRIVNDSATFAAETESPILSNLIVALGQQGILFVTAAGNSGANNDQKSRFPCNYHRQTEICVTASDNRDHLPTWANYGPGHVDLAAPGESIFSTLREGQYGYLSGGSMASAQVSGAAALILSAKEMSVVELKENILNNVDVLPALKGKIGTNGRLDVCKSIAATGRACPAPVANEPPPPKPPPPPPPVEPPVLASIGSLRISPPNFIPARNGPAIMTRTQGSSGASVSYTDSQPSLVTFTVLALRRGVQNSAHKCVAPTENGHRLTGKKCTRLVKVGSFAHQDQVGRNKLRFSGRLHGRKLSKGRYRLELLPTFAGHAGVGTWATFHIAH